jgi:hypothetical protein
LLAKGVLVRVDVVELKDIVGLRSIYELVSSDDLGLDSRRGAGLSTCRYLARDLRIPKNVDGGMLQQAAKTLSVCYQAPK